MEAICCAHAIGKINVLISRMLSGYLTADGKQKLQSTTATLQQAQGNTVQHLATIGMSATAIAEGGSFKTSRKTQMRNFIISTR